MPGSMRQSTELLKKVAANRTGTQRLSEIEYRDTQTQLSYIYDDWDKVTEAGSRYNESFTRDLFRMELLFPEDLNKNLGSVLERIGRPKPSASKVA